MKNSLIYITGASGFIGSNLIKKYDENNVIYRLVSRKKINNKSSIFLKKYRELVAEDNSSLIHLAENNRVDEAKLLGNKLIKENTDTMLNLMKNKWKHVVYLSSALVYDFNNPDYKNGNNMELIKASSIYQESKIECEKIVLEQGGTVLRMTNIFGPGMSKYNIFSDIINQLKTNNPIILKNLSSVRDFLWIEDAIEAIIQANKKKVKGIFNIASGRSINIEKLVGKILKIANKSEKEVIGKEKNLGTLNVKININKSKEYLDWEPRTSLENGIKKTLYYKNY